MKKRSNPQGSEHDVVCTSRGHGVSISIVIGRSSTDGQVSVSRSISHGYSINTVEVVAENTSGKDVQ